MHGLVTELRQTWRSLLRRPGYAAVVVLTLGLGIGATTTIYSVVDTMLIRALPYPDADRLVVLGNTTPGQEWVGERDGLQRLAAISLPNLNDLVARGKVVQRAAALERSTWVAPDQGNGPELLQVANVTAGFFEMLSVKPILGRLLLPSDYWTPGGGGWGTLITHDVWQHRFGGDPHVVGKRLDGSGSFGSFIVVGVLPRDFHQPAALVGSEVEFWMHLDPADRRYQARQRRNVRVLARLDAGVSIEQARADLAVAQAQLVQDERAGNLLPDGTPLGIGVNSLRDETVGSAGGPMLILLGAALLLLVLAGTNAANLLLVRGLEREGELALRRALGAGRMRLGGGLVAESVSLALAGGVLGLGIAEAGVAAFRRFGPASLPRIEEVGVNPRVAAAGVLLSILVGVTIGIVPAVRSGGVDLLATLRSSIQSMTQRGNRLRTGLAAVQLALALVLGIGASLLFRSFMQLRTEHLGFEPARLVAFRVPLKTERPWEAWDRLLDAVRSIPGVTSAAAASNLPFQTPSWKPRVERAEQVGEASNEGIPGYAVTPGFFEVSGIAVVRGRSFDTSDQPESRPVAIVNQSFARAVLADRDPIGAQIRLPDDAGAGGTLEVIGVVADVVQGRVEDGIGPAIYVPYTQTHGAPHVLVASDRDPAALGTDIRRAVGRAGFPFPVSELSTMESRIEASRAGPRFQLLLIGAFAGAALALSAIGLYGTLAFTVRSRTKELGIRMAMGAGRRTIYGLVMKQGMIVLGIGLAAGLIGAIGLTRLLQGFLFRVRPIDPPAFLIAIAVMAAAVLVAAMLPAARAARIDPMSSIRVE